MELPHLSGCTVDDILDRIDSVELTLNDMDRTEHIVIYHNHARVYFDYAYRNNEF